MTTDQRRLINYTLALIVCLANMVLAMGMMFKSFPDSCGLIVLVEFVLGWSYAYKRLGKE